MGTSSAGRVEYRHVQENLLGLPVELDDAENLAEVTAHKALQAEAKESELKKAKMESDPEEPKPLILLQSCLARFAAPTNAVPFRGSMADKTHRIATMPRYLLIQVRRFFRDEQWMPSKLNCKVPMPDKLSLEQFRGTGRQPGESNGLIVMLHRLLLLTHRQHLKWSRIQPWSQRWKAWGFVQVMLRSGQHWQFKIRA